MEYFNIMLIQVIKSLELVVYFRNTWEAMRKKEIMAFLSKLINHQLPILVFLRNRFIQNFPTYIICCGLCFLSWKWKCLKRLQRVLKSYIVFKSLLINYNSKILLLNSDQTVVNVFICLIPFSSRQAMLFQERTSTKPILIYCKEMPNFLHKVSIGAQTHSLSVWGNRC